MHRAFKKSLILLSLLANRGDCLNLPSGYSQKENGVLREKDNAIMVHIPLGSYFVGSEDPLHPPEEKPLLYARLKEYLMDQREISRRQYQACVMGGGCEALGLSFDPKLEELPVNYVSWTQARSYCQWVGADLPTELQWETAARGKSSTVFPTGIRASNSQTAELIPVSMAEVNEGFSVALMSLNLSEWTLDEALMDDSGNLLPRRLQKEQMESRRVEDYLFHEAGSGYRIVKGASFKSAFANFQRASVRRGVAKDQSLDWVGFRCSLSLP